jgi:hypothetical protein
MGRVNSILFGEICEEGLRDLEEGFDKVTMSNNPVSFEWPD